MSRSRKKRGNKRLSYCLMPAKRSSAIATFDGAFDKLRKPLFAGFSLHLLEIRMAGGNTPIEPLQNILNSH
jgi:hypothetical protein